MDITGLVRAGFTYHLEVVRGGVVIDSDWFHNLIPTEGIYHIVNTVFAGGVQIPTWYIGIFEGNYTPVAGDTAATFSSLSTESSAYSETARPTWQKGTISAGLITNVLNRAVFSMNADKTIYGAFMSSASPKQAVTGTLVSAARFNSPKILSSGDVLNVTAGLTLSSI